MKLTPIMIHMLREAKANGLKGISTQDDFTEEQHMAIKHLYDGGLIDSDVEPQHYFGQAAAHYTRCPITALGLEKLEAIDAEDERRPTVEECKTIIILIIDLTVKARDMDAEKGEQAKEVVRNADDEQTESMFKQFGNLSMVDWISLVSSGYTLAGGAMGLIAG